MTETPCPALPMMPGMLRRPQGMGPGMTRPRGRLVMRSSRRYHPSPRRCAPGLSEAQAQRTACTAVCCCRRIRGFRPASWSAASVPPALLFLTQAGRSSWRLHGGCCQHEGTPVILPVQEDKRGPAWLLGCSCLQRQSTLHSPSSAACRRTRAPRPGSWGAAGLQGPTTCLGQRRSSRRCLERVLACRAGRRVQPQSPLRGRGRQMWRCIFPPESSSCLPFQG